jgi:small-conductance mechanosensitive channel
VQLLLICLALWPFAHFLPHTLASAGDKLFGFLAPLLTLYLLAQSFDHIVFGWYMLRFRDGAVPTIIRFVVMAVVYIVLSMIFLEWVFGLNILPVLATSTVLTAVLGLALQDTLKNLFAGLTMSFEKRFTLGDWVMFRVDANNSTTGEVTEVGWRTTKIRTLEGNYSIIPNALFTSNQLTNFSQPTPCSLRSLEFPVLIKTDLAFVQSTLLAAAARVEGVLKEPIAEAQPISLKPDHMVIRLRFWISDFARADTITGLVMEQCLKELVVSDAVPACPPA